MNLRKIFTSRKLLSILHNILNNDTIEKKHLKINKEEITSYNQYTLFIVIEFTVKYSIIINRDDYIDYYLDELEKILNTYNSHRELVIALNKLIIDLCFTILNITDRNSSKSERLVLDYIYDKYIVNGYCFHSFPSSFKDSVEEKGLSINVDYKERAILKKINYIFSNHNYKNIIPKDLNSKVEAICITDSIAMAYYYAIRSPYYMAVITSLSNYYQNVSGYDEEAFYRKDYDGCKNNLSMLCEHLKMTVKEKDTILKSFDKEWKSLDLSNAFPCIAFIKRSDLAKDSLDNIDYIRSLIGKEKLEVLVSKIMDSRYSIIKRYTNISSLFIKIVTLPSYQEIREERVKDNNSIMVLDSPKVKVEPRKEMPLKYSYGRASILALTGLFLITLGMTLSIILKALGG